MFFCSVYCRDVAVVQLNATDLDFGGKARLEYEIADGNKDGKFRINSKTGLITVNNSNNLASHYQLKVSTVLIITIYFHVTQTPVLCYRSHGTVCSLYWLYVQASLFISITGISSIYVSNVYFFTSVVSKSKDCLKLKMHVKKTFKHLVSSLM